MKELGLSQEETKEIFFDNKSAIALAKNTEVNILTLTTISYGSAVKEKKYKQSMSNHKVRRLL